jgi:hypothetical protein
MLRLGWAWVCDFARFEGLAIMAILLGLYLLGVFQI